MSKLTEYTVELYRADKRIKRDERYGRNRVGLRFVEIKEFAPVTKDNMMSGKEYQERYDTPHFCSPSSETYWSM